MTTTRTRTLSSLTSERTSPVTRAMLGVLDHDDRIDPQPACAELGLTLTPLDETLRRTFVPASSSDSQEPESA